MSPIEAKVAVIEDNSQWRKIIKRLVERDGHSVVLEASTPKEAYEAVKKFDELGVQVVTIDGNLSPDDTSGYDGRSVLAAVRKMTPTVKTIGMSGGTVEGVDVNVGKNKAEELSKTITNL